jgi:hypothetical protein
MSAVFDGALTAADHKQHIPVAFDVPANFIMAELRDEAGLSTR